MRDAENGMPLDSSVAQAVVISRWPQSSSL